VGAQVLKDTTEFFTNFEGMYEGFKQRAQSVFELLRSPEAGFVVVTSPTQVAVEDAIFFAETLREHRLPFEGLIVNRVSPSFEISKAPKGASQPVRRLFEIAGDLNSLAEAQTKCLARLKGKIAADRVVSIPWLEGEVCDLKSLNVVADHIIAA
jgi:anion-transporting  ArsA/GET3 family ATPase